MSYRESDIYKAIVSSKDRDKLLNGVRSVIESNNFADDFVDSIKNIATVLVQGTWSKRALAAAALLYLVMPLDLVPDFIPIAGWADDVFVIGTVLTKLSE